ncbi:MAG: hypothetical protein J0L96_13940 [Anaerolineae bacterium]|nr:hypothetical protein [Anaerolineae bacterium]
MKKLPTDLQILNQIYEQYYNSFVTFSNDKKDRDTKIYIPIDIEKISKKLGVDIDIVFGRLYYHLDKKYGYKNEDGSSVYLFALKIGNDRHCINFPLAASVLAGLRDEDKRHQTSITLAVVSLFISIISILLSIFSF